LWKPSLGGGFHILFLNQLRDWKFWLATAETDAKTKAGFDVENDLTKTDFIITLSQQSWIRALDSKFKICSKKLTNFRICYKALKSLYCK
jgi:hypothetical protein